MSESEELVFWFGWLSGALTVGGLQMIAVSIFGPVGALYAGIAGVTFGIWSVYVSSKRVTDDE